MSYRYESRTVSLRFSLLASLGLLPVACGGTSTDGADQRRPVNVTCTSPQLDPKTGLQSCREGYVHRPKVVTCGDATGDADAPPGAGDGGGVDQRSLPRSMGEMRCDADVSVCAAFQFGYCRSDLGGAFCRSGCGSDADCEPNAICVCGGASSTPWGVCTSSNCTSDADCGPGLRCASFSAGCGGGYACQTRLDTCLAPSDCSSGQTCQPDEDGRRTCSPASICGRPFLVDEQPRVAPIVARNDWLLAPLG